MSTEELKVFENKYRFKLKEFVGRAYGVNNDERITYAGQAENIETIDQAAIERGLKESSKVAGIFALYGSISDSILLTQVLQDNNVFL